LFRCQTPVLVDNSDNNLAMCDQCRYIFCKKCKEIFHSETICPKDYIIQQLQLQHVSLVNVSSIIFSQLMKGSRKHVKIRGFRVDCAKYINGL